MGHTDSVDSVAFSPDGRTLVSGSSDTTVRMWYAATRQPLGQPLTAHTGAVNAVAFSADGKLLVSGSSDGSVQLWDAATRQPLGQPLTGHTGDGTTVAFSPDDRTLASGSSDGTVQLWDVGRDAWIELACRVADRNLTQVEWTAFMRAETAYQRTCPDLPPGDGTPADAP